MHSIYELQFIKTNKTILLHSEQETLPIGKHYICAVPELYMEGNTSISEEWKKNIMDRRKELKDYE